MTFICSNNFPLRVKILEEKFNYNNFITYAFYSFNFKSLKLESTVMFDEIILKSGLKKEEICLIDGGKENIAFAKEYGFGGILFEGYVKLMEDLEEYGVKI